MDKPMQIASRILIVDDYEINRNILSHLVQSLGYTPILASNGKMALPQLEKESPDLVLLDILMPEMNGYEVLEHIKSNPHLCHIPVIMVSAVDEQESVVLCIKKGAEDYLIKPFNATFLKARIHACLDRKHLRDNEKRLHDELARNYKALQAAEQARDAVLHMIVHDLRNPVTAIVGYIQLLQMKMVSGNIDSDGLGNSLQFMYDATEEITSLIAGILDVSRLETGELPISLGRLEAVEHLKNISDRFKPLAERKNLRIILNTDTDTIVIQSDKELFSRIMQNLIINALKHAKTIVAVSIERQTDKALVSVADDGPGIPDEYKEKIFDKFFQIHNDSHTSTYGVGLGLTFCKMAVEALGGKIWVEDCEGNGVIVRFSAMLPPG